MITHEVEDVPDTRAQGRHPGVVRNTPCPAVESGAMDLRRGTGYLALALLALYLLWVLSRTAPQLRKGSRDRTVRARVLLVRTAGVVLAALFVATVHFWATAWWQVAVAVPVALGPATALYRTHRRLVALPRHRAPLGQRVRRAGHFQVIRPAAPAPRRHAADDVPPGTVPFVVPFGVPDTDTGLPGRDPAEGDPAPGDEADPRHPDGAC